ncbi:MAG TPA: hypothetical protein VM327_04550 [Candidatus Thermoplasmatota archaeon]|nr:hypothetical protein [Candidatus Thermoplasmatota archaeon]
MEDKSMPDNANHETPAPVTNGHLATTVLETAPQQETPEVKTPRKRINRPFPSETFEDALEIGNGIQEHASGQPVRRMTLLDKLGKSPDSGPTRALITSSGKYGITTGGYSAEVLALTPDGKTATDPEAPPQARAHARFKLAIADIEAFRLLHDRFKGNKLPAKAVMEDTLAEVGVDPEIRSECVDVFVTNLKFIGALKTLSGAERVVSLEHLLEGLPTAAAPTVRGQETREAPAVSGTAYSTTSDVAWDKTCFYIAPIGEEGSEERLHSDLFLEAIVRPAVEPLGLQVVRADAIGKAGMIGHQTFEHTLRAKIVVADLSFLNPNVFYELCLRHAARLPTIHIARSADRIPFDIQQTRVVRIDTTTIYTLVPKLETYKAEIASQLRKALQDDGPAENPLSAFSTGLTLNSPYAKKA